MFHTIKHTLMAFIEQNFGCKHTFWTEKNTPTSLNLAETQLVLDFEGKH